MCDDSTTTFFCYSALNGTTTKYMWKRIETPRKTTNESSLEFQSTFLKSDGMMTSRWSFFLFFLILFFLFWQDKYTEWREFLVQRLTGARSLPYQFHQRVVDACRSRFRRGMTVELVDRNRLSTVRNFGFLFLFRNWPKSRPTEGSAKRGERGSMF